MEKPVFSGTPDLWDIPTNLMDPYSELCFSWQEDGRNSGVLQLGPLLSNDILLCENVNPKY
jgi:hypothetical protein